MKRVTEEESNGYVVLLRLRGEWRYKDGKRHPETP